jgi:soluble lytic murein transglycosylase-like protein
MATWMRLGNAALSTLQALSSARMGDINTVDLRQAIVDEANSQGVPPEIALAIATQESGIQQWRSDGSLVIGGAGDTGIFQLLPSTAAGLGVDPTDPLQNIHGGVSYLRQMFNRYGDWPTAIGAYNIGPGNADANLRLNMPVTKWKNYLSYVQLVLDRAGSMQTFAADSSGVDGGAQVMPDVSVQSSNTPLVIGGIAAAAIGVKWLVDWMDG